MDTMLYGQPHFVLMDNKPQSQETFLKLSAEAAVLEESAIKGYAQKVSTRTHYRKFVSAFLRQLCISSEDAKTCAHVARFMDMSGRYVANKGALPIGPPMGMVVSGRKRWAISFGAFVDIAEAIGFSTFDPNAAYTPTHVGKKALLSVVPVRPSLSSSASGLAGLLRVQCALSGASTGGVTAGENGHEVRSRYVDNAPMDSERTLTYAPPRAEQEISGVSGVPPRRAVGQEVSGVSGAPPRRAVGQEVSGVSGAPPRRAAGYEVSGVSGAPPRRAAGQEVSGSAMDPNLMAEFQEFLKFKEMMASKKAA